MSPGPKQYSFPDWVTPNLATYLQDVANQLFHLQQKVDALMSAETDLAAAVASISTAVSGAVAEIQTIAAALASAGSTDPASTTAAIEAAVTSLNGLATNLNSAVSAAQPAPAPAPAAAAAAEH